MNERNNINRFRSLVNTANKKLSGLNKGSKVLLGIGKAVLFIFLLAALFLVIMFMSNPTFLGGQVKLVEWIVLYSFRFWVILIIGALIMDILIKKN